MESIVMIKSRVLFFSSCLRRKSQQAEREYEKVKHQLENLEESVRDRCKKEFTGHYTQAIYQQNIGEYMGNMYSQWRNRKAIVMLSGDCRELKKAQLAWAF